MKLNKKLIRFSIMASLMLVGFVIANPVMLSAESDEVDFPTFDLFVDGSADVKSTFFLNSKISLPTPYDDFLSLDVGFEFVPEQQVFSESLTVHKISKVGFDTWRIEFTQILNAPRINIWDGPAVVSQGPALSVTENDVRILTEEEAQSEKDMGLSFVYGSTTNLFKNDTDDSFTTLAYTTDFDLDTYNILYLEDFNSKGTSNVTVIVSYVEITTYVNLNATYAYNKTIFNEFVPQNQNSWFALDLENTNTTFDEYVAHIAITNMESNGMRSVRATNANITDTRYNDMFVGDFDTAVTLSALEPRHVYDYVGDPINVDRTSFGPSLSGLELNGWINTISASDILSLPSELVDLTGDVTNEALGWVDASSLGDTILGGIADLNSNVGGLTDLFNLDVTSLIGSWGITQTTKNIMGDAIATGAEIYDTVGDVGEFVADKSYETILFATDLGASAIETTGNTANAAVDATKGAFASAKEKVSNFGSDVKDFVVDSAGKIKDGAISIVAKAKKFIGGGIKNIMMIIGIALIALIVLFVVFSRMGIMPSM